MSKDYKDKLKEKGFQDQEILKFIPEIVEKTTKKDWFWEGWIDFDVGDPVTPINMYSLKVSGDQRDIAQIVETVNDTQIGKKLNRHTLEIIKKMFTKKGIEVLAEEKNRETAAEAGTI